MYCNGNAVNPMMFIFKLKHQRTAADRTVQILRCGTKVSDLQGVLLNYLTHFLGFGPTIPKGRNNCGLKGEFPVEERL